MDTGDCSGKGEGTHRQAVYDVDASEQRAGRVRLREDGQPPFRRMHLRVERLQLLSSRKWMGD